MLIALSGAAFAQRDSTFRLAHTAEYKQIALNIIRYLGIPHRNSYLKDGRLMFALNKPGNFSERAPAHGMFIRGTYLYKSRDTVNVIYPAPTVYISSNIYNDLQKKADTSERFIRALSCVLHEITHYYQFINYNYISYKSSGDYHAYFCQPYEIDAYAVEAFYYLSRRNPRQLQKILNSNNGDNNLVKRELIKEHSRILRRPVLSELLELVCP